MTNWGDNTLTFEQAAALVPLRAEIRWIEDNISNGGPLHIVVADGNYEDDHIDFCINTITDKKQGKYWAECHTQEDLNRLLEVAQALKHLTIQQREMVCENNVITQKAFDKLNDQLQDDEFYGY